MGFISPSLSMFKKGESEIGEEVREKEKTIGKEERKGGEKGNGEREGEGEGEGEKKKDPSCSIPSISRPVSFPVASEWLNGRKDSKLLLG